MEKRQTVRSAGYGDPARHVRHLYVEEDCLDLEYSREIIDRFGGRYTVLPPGGAPSLPSRGADVLAPGKQRLVLARNRGRFFKPCPGTREYRCCDYQVLNVGSGCPMDCVYCILQAYLNYPCLRFHVNIDQMFAELDEALGRQGGFFRIGTGEFTDSLALDSLTALAPRLVRYMADQEQGILELKSKSAVISGLQYVEHRGRTVLAWSLNSPPVMDREEIRTASLDERLAAAARCAEWGYWLAFHFDPIIAHPGWEQGYRYTIERLFDRVPADRIVWISLGGLRFLPSLKEVACRRFPGTRIFFHEFITGLDGKARYFRDERVAMYRLIAGEIDRRRDHRTCVYFCMENDTVWQEVFGYVPGDRGGLPAMLDEAVRRKR